jgi:cellulose synthase/poly-beta-1,6-N-acetylglucosamine synthase-like glycosyltransferase
MNLALEKVDTDLVGSLDADSFVDSQALKNIALHFKKERVAAVTSVIKILPDKNI